MATEPDDEGQEIGDHSEYIIGRQVGFGGFSVVKEAFTIENGEKVARAVKIVKKRVSGKTESQNDEFQSAFEHEVSIWRFLQHRYILPLIAVYDSPFATFCVTKLNIGGTLFDLVRERRRAADRSRSQSSESQSQSPLPRKSSGSYGFPAEGTTLLRGIPQHLARRYSYQLASAIRYLHEDVRVVHRDIKLENCLLDMSGPRAMEDGGNVVLCDFGMADFIASEIRSTPSPCMSPSPSPPPVEHKIRTKAAPSVKSPKSVNKSAASFPNESNGTSSEIATAVTGSLAYAAPETLSSTTPIFSPTVDIWAFGVVLYALSTGNLPFSHPFEPRLVTAILKGVFDIEILQKAGMAQDATSRIEACLDADTERRPSIGEVLECSWYRGCNDESEVEVEESSTW